MKIFGRKTLAVLLMTLLYMCIISTTVSADEISTMEEQYEVLAGYMNLKNSTRSDRVSGQITAVLKEDTKIFVGISDITDENMKNAILSLPGISSDMVEFGTFEVTWTGPAVLDSAEVERINREARATKTLKIGSVITVDGRNGVYGLTVGYPTSGLGRDFVTANHNAIQRGDWVLNGAPGLTGPQEQIGSIGQISFNSTTDASRADITNTNFLVPLSLPNGSTLSGYKAQVPSTGTSVTAFTGFSGTVRGTIQSVGTVGGGPGGTNRSDVIVVYMSTRPGDSGSVLVNGNNAAIGVLSFGASLSGRDVTIFTKSTNIPW